jgi:Carboxypeptidase regulatory-like domain
MRKAIARVLAAIMVLGMPAGPLAAGATAAAISGMAKDARGGGLMGASLRVRNSDRGNVILEIRTGAAGQFSVPSLQPGSYIVEALDSSGQVIGVSPTVSTIAGETAMVTVTAAGTQTSRALSQAGFSLSGLGTGASAGIVAAVAAAPVTTVAVAASSVPVPSPSQ